MPTFLAMVSPMWATAISLIVAFVLIVLFLVQRKVFDVQKDTIKTHTIVFSYAAYMLLFAIGIGFVASLWGYDVSDYLLEAFAGFTSGLEANIPRLIATLVVLFIALAMFKIIKLTLFKIGNKPTPNQRRKKTISKITLSLVRYFGGLILMLIILAIWGVNVGPALAGLGIAGLVIGLGAQKFINDLISGLFIIFEHHFDVGDWIDVNGFSGEVIDIGLKSTRVRNIRGEVRIFNNGSIAPVSNFSINEAVAIIDFSIAYKEDVAKTIEILSQELPKLREDNENLLENPRILGVTELADSGVNLRIATRTKIMTQWGVERALRQRIKEILDAHDIEIPFPQVTVHKPKE